MYKNKSISYLQSFAVQVVLKKVSWRTYRETNVLMYTGFTHA